MTRKSPCSQHSSWMCNFLRGWHTEGREKGLRNREANHYRTEMPVHEHKQKEKWDKKSKLKPLNLKKKERKKHWDKERPGNSPINAKKQETISPARDFVASRSHWSSLSCDSTSPWSSWKVCDFDVTGSCDVISLDHFVRGFYDSSFRRRGLNCFGRQKNNKILVRFFLSVKNWSNQPTGIY